MLGLWAFASANRNIFGGRIDLKARADTRASMVDR